MTPELRTELEALAESADRAAERYDHQMTEHQQQLDRATLRRDTERHVAAALRAQIERGDAPTPDPTLPPMSMPEFVQRLRGDTETRTLGRVIAEQLLTVPDSAIWPLPDDDTRWTPAKGRTLIVVICSDQEGTSGSLSVDAIRIARRDTTITLRGQP